MMYAMHVRECRFLDKEFRVLDMLFQVGGGAIWRRGQKPVKSPLQSLIA